MGWKQASLPKKKGTGGLYIPSLLPNLASKICIECIETIRECIDCANNMYYSTRKIDGENDATN